MIEDHPIEIDSSLGWLYRYREQFGHDVMPDVLPLAEAILAGLGELFGEVVIDGDAKYLDVSKVPELMDSDVMVEMAVKMAGMEFTTITNIFWAMAKNADNSIKPPEVFINQFERFPMDEVAPGLLYAIANSSMSSKNSASLLAKMRDKIPSLSMWSQSPESTEG